MFTIIETATMFPVDVIASQEAAAHRIDVLERDNPGCEFSYRKASVAEKRNADIIRADAINAGLDV